MKDKIKEWLFLIVYFIGGVLIFGFIESDKFQETTIGNIVQILSVIAGLVIFGFIAYMFIVTIYVSIKEWFRKKVRQEAIQVVKEQKELEELLNKGGNDEEN